MRKLLVAVMALVGVAVATSVSQAQPTASSAAAVSCGTTRTIGFMAPFTGPAASVGQQQVRWNKFYVSQYNKTHKTKIKVVNQDTQLGAASGSAEALKGAKALASNSSVLGVVGPAGSNEVEGVRKTLKSAGFAFSTGSATADRLTQAKNGTRGYFFRAVPPDAKQGTTVANLIVTKLKSKNIHIIDDQETYSTGLADIVQAKLKAAGKTVTRDGVSQQESDFSALIAGIDRNVDLIYIPWQLSDKAKAFGTQLKQAGRASTNIMGSDGLYSNDFAALGKNVYDSMFPVSITNSAVAKYRAAHGGNGDYFGAPTYAATQIIVEAVDRACADGTATRAEVRKEAAKTNIKNSLLGFTINFNNAGELKAGVFALYKSDGKQFIPLK
ncbi:MAG: branched-chain amino acid ABC transporter substrate-binding protein [Gaiellaceae bacterium]